MIGGIIILEFKRFELRDKPLIDKYFEQHHYEASDNCFTTLFMWQDAYGIPTIRATLISPKKPAVHDPERLGKVIMDIVHAMQSDTEPHILEYYLQRDDH